MKKSFSRVAALAACLIGTGDGFLLPVPSTTTTTTARAISSIKHMLSRQQLQQRCHQYPLGVATLNSAISWSNGELQPGISSIDAANPGLYDKLSRLRDNAYFKLFSVDILASCEYMPQELFECYSETCEIYPVDEDEVRQKKTEVVSQ